MKLVSRNYLGIFIISISVIMFLILLSVSLSYARITHAQCGSPTCTVTSHIPIQSYVGFSLMIALAGTGGYVAFLPQKTENLKSVSKVKMNKLVEVLQGDEKKIFNEIRKNDGSIFQNDLIGSTNFSKVKVSRILDRLETKGIVERRRRGMANLVLSKFE